MTVNGKVLKPLTMFLYTLALMMVNKLQGVFGNGGYFYDKDSGAKMNLGCYQSFTFTSTITGTILMEKEKS